MASLFDPRCGLSTYEQTDINVVKRCAKISAYFFAGIMSLVVVGVAISIYFSNSKSIDNDPNTSSTEKNKKKGTLLAATLIISVIILLILWIGIPAFGAWSAGQSWKSYQHERSFLKSQGYSSKDIAKFQQKNYNQQMRAKAVQNAGSEIAGAIVSRNNWFKG